MEANPSYIPTVKVIHLPDTNAHFTYFSSHVVVRLGSQQGIVDMYQFLCNFSY